MEQKTVKILGFKAQNHNIIKTVVLTPDIMQKRLVILVGNSGNGKSTLIEMLQTAIAGTDAIKKKSILEKGYLTEVLLLDGDIKLYAGAKVTEYQRGESAGEPKFEIFLYSKDANGNQYTPIIDGVKATAANYAKMLNTDLTFNMRALFTENQTEHRKLIESLFKPELDSLGAEAVVERIIKAKAHRDACRTLCQGSGAYMERFEAEGYTESMLNLIKRPDIKAIENKLFEAKLELDRLTNGSEDRYKLEEEKLNSERTAALQKIKDEGIDLREKIRVDNEAKQKEYDAKKANYDSLLKQYESDMQTLNDILSLASCLSPERLEKLTLVVKEEITEREKTKPIAPVLEAADGSLNERLANKLSEYKKLEETPLPTITKDTVDTSEVEAKIKVIETEKEGAEATANLYDRYQLWLKWIEAKGLYEKEVDTLRKMYASIDTGVKGMHIVPVETESDRVEVWVQYDGSYDKEFFHNDNAELRFMFQYSSFQRSAIGVMLQAARLNLKPKALRLAIVDDVAFTSKGLAVLEKMCEDFNVQLITAKTDDYDKENIQDGEVIVEGGEVFFNKN